LYRLAAGEKIKRFIACGNQKPGRETVRAFCWAWQARSRKILCVCTAFMSVTSKPKRYNPRHPKRTLLCPTIAEHSRPGLGWLVLASNGQCEGQGDHHTPRPLCAKRFAKTSSAAPFRTVLPKQGMATAATTNSWPSPAKAFACAPPATPGACWRRRRT